MSRRDDGPGPTTIPLFYPQEAVAFDREAFDDVLIRPNGVKFIHHHAMACPVGKSDPDDVRRPHDDHTGCSNGFILIKAGEVTVGFTGNSKNSRFEELGRMDDATVTVVLPRFYDGDGDSCDPETKRIYLAPFDRMYLKTESILVPTWETFASSGNGLDKVRFPVAKVEHLVDSQGAFRTLDTDFVLEDGKLRWLPGKIPPTDLRTGKGMVIGIRYLYKPYWYVSRLPHEVRVAHVDSTEDGDGVERMPQLAQLTREHVFENENQDPEAKDARSPRQVQPPVDRTVAIPTHLGPV